MENNDEGIVEIGLCGGGQNTTYLVHGFDDDGGVFESKIPPCVHDAIYENRRQRLIAEEEKMAKDAKKAKKTKRSTYDMKRKTYENHRRQ